jgi:SPX domain protein involved in polyphosphate accumulation
MSFRKEEKLHVNINKLHDLLDWIFKNDGRKLYDTRVISSTYFDNDELQMFLDSEEGCVPRKKIRVRSYAKHAHKTGNSALEIKTSSIEGRFKTTNKNINIERIMSLGFFDQDYGVCKSKVRVNYKRDYYQVHGVRITIDRHIEYVKLNNQGVAVYKNFDTDVIVEVKAKDSIPIEYLHQKFYFARVRFSKYSRAINSFIES